MAEVMARNTHRTFAHMMVKVWSAAAIAAAEARRLAEENAKALEQFMSMTLAAEHKHAAEMENAHAETQHVLRQF